MRLFRICGAVFDKGDIVPFCKYILPGPGAILFFVLFVIVYQSSPPWAQNIGWPTREGDRARTIASCEKLVDCEVAVNAVVVHDAGQPIPPSALAEWTPQRVEFRFDSGLAVVSSLGPHGNLQYVVRDLDLSVGSVFRILNGEVVKVV